MKTDSLRAYGLRLNAMRERGTDGRLGDFPAYAWPGGYPIAYFPASDGVLCPACVNKNRALVYGAKRSCDRSWEIFARDVHWEGMPLVCDACGAEIESAYGSESEGAHD